MLRMNQSLSRIAYLLLPAIACGASVYAGSFSVNPVRIELTAARPNALVQIANLSDEPTIIQVHVVSWRSDNNNESVYLPTDDVLVNPPIFTVDPRQKQFMRLGLRRPASAPAEASYRLIVEEVPKPPAPGFVGLQTVLRISIPIFLKPVTPVSPKLAWRVDYTNRDSVRLTAMNQGNAHIQITGLELTPVGANRTPIKTSVLDYLLPNQARTWIIESARISGLVQIRLTAHTDAGNIYEVLVPNGR